jgi:hypothetical protein
MVETTYMKHEGLHYWQCLLVKEQANANKNGYERSSNIGGMAGDLIL